MKFLKQIIFILCLSTINIYGQCVNSAFNYNNSNWFTQSVSLSANNTYELSFQSIATNAGGILRVGITGPGGLNKFENIIDGTHQPVIPNITPQSNGNYTIYVQKSNASSSLSVNNLCLENLSNSSPPPSSGDCINSAFNYNNSSWFTQSVSLSANTTYELNFQSIATNAVGILRVGITGPGGLNKFENIINGTHQRVIPNITPQSNGNYSIYVQKSNASSSLSVNNLCLSSGSGINSNSNFTSLKDYPTPVTNPNALSNNDCGMYIGAATPLEFPFVDNNVLDLQEKKAYMETLVNHFNIATTENALKRHVIRNSFLGNNNYEAVRQSLDLLLLGDPSIGMIGNPNLKVRGHTLCWHGGEDSPPYLQGLSNQHLEEDLVDYIKDVITDMNESPKYGGKFESWDVVNEAIVHNGEGFRNENSSDGVDCVWGKLGNESYLYANGYAIPKYIRMAFDAAADVTPPSQPLVYNDTDAEFTKYKDWNNNWQNNKKAETQFQMIKTLKENGVRIDGVGFECHFELGEVTDKLHFFRSNIQRYINQTGPAWQNFKIYFTEVDIRIPDNASAADKVKQANEYKALMKLALEFDEVEAFVVWGVSDNYSWIPQTPFFAGFGQALLFTNGPNNTMTKKPTYDKVLEAINEDPCNVSSAKLNNQTIINNEEEILLYPNPVQDQLNISIKDITNIDKEDIQVEIIDLSGKVISETRFNSGGQLYSINTSALEKGMYLIRLSNQVGKNVGIYKFIK